MPKSYNIIIIGAGVNGLSQAAALCQAGFHVAVVDAGAKPSLKITPEYDVRVFAINRYTQQCLQQWQIWQNIELSRLAQYHQVNLAFADAQPSLQFNEHDDAEPNLGHIVEQQVWRSAALEVLLDHSHCDFFWQHELIAINNNNLVLDSRETKQQIELRCELIIGADGGRSKVRTLAGISCDQFSCKQTALICNLKIEQPHRFTAYQFFGSHGILAFLPLADLHHYSIVWSIPDEQLWLNELSDEALACELNNICDKRWGEIQIASKRYHFPLVQQQAREYSRNNIVLIGDAAHTIHPLAGQGANLGVADIAELTQQLIWAKTKNRPLADTNILKFYARSRRSAAWQTISLMSILQQSASKNIIINQLLKHSSALIDHLPSIKNLLTKFALYRLTK